MQAYKLHAAVVISLTTISTAAHGEVRFNRDIRPIMAETCFRCHGPDKSSRMAGMRLDLRDEALKPTARGVVPIVPGDPDRSAVIQRIFAKDAKVMPPAFIQERLAREKMHPSPEADRRTLIRRVTLDLTGLPPAPEDVAAFLKDDAPNAYEKLVDRLLATPQYAEQQTMHWLDVVRYADT